MGINSFEQTNKNRVTIVQIEVERFQVTIITP
jgi:hypothetical protein